MGEPNTPRRMIKSLLRGELPSRPLLMPTIFALGSRLENLSLHDFQRNPTKITNALRQIRGVLKVDGLACYCDPFLEAEALGGKLLSRPDGSLTLEIPGYLGVDALRRKLPSAEDIVRKGSISIAGEVVHRLRVMLHDDPALMVHVTGPLTLATQLLGEWEAEPPLDLLEFCAEITAAVSRYLVESGADIVFLVESSLPRMSAGSWESWASLLDPIFNAIRFYESLPVLVLRDSGSPREDLKTMLQRNWECVLCPAINGVEEITKELARQPALGVALPTNFGWRSIGESETVSTQIMQVVREQKPVLVISTGDLPLGGDMRQLASMLGAIRSTVETAA